MDHWHKYLNPFRLQRHGSIAIPLFKKKKFLPKAVNYMVAFWSNSSSEEFGFTFARPFGLVLTELENVVMISSVSVSDLENKQIFLL